MQRLLAPVIPFAAMHPAGDRGRAKHVLHFRASLAGFAVLKTAPGVMTAPREWPHVVESPDDRHLQLAHGMNARDAAVYPMEIDDIGLKSLREFAQVSAL